MLAHDEKVANTPIGDVIETYRGFWLYKVSIYSNRGLCSIQIVDCENGFTTYDHDRADAHKTIDAIIKGVF